MPVGMSLSVELRYEDVDYTHCSTPLVPVLALQALRPHMLIPTCSPTLPFSGPTKLYRLQYVELRCDYTHFSTPHEAPFSLSQALPSFIVCSTWSSDVTTLTFRFHMKLLRLWKPWRPYIFAPPISKVEDLMQSPWIINPERSARNPQHFQNHDQHSQAWWHICTSWE